MNERSKIDEEDRCDEKADQLRPRPAIERGGNPPRAVNHGDRHQSLMFPRVKSRGQME